MPRPRHAMGRPGTRVFPPDWQDTHAAVVEDTLDCTVTISPPGATPAWNEARGQTETPPPSAVAYAGAASITPVVEDTTQTVAAADVVPTIAYEVKLAAPVATVKGGHIVTVNTCPKDSMLVGVRLQVTAVEMGSRRFSRVLRAVVAD